MFGSSLDDDEGDFMSTATRGWAYVLFDLHFCFFLWSGHQDGGKPSPRDNFLCVLNSSSKLASLFGQDRASFSGGNESLTYTAPKQPKKEKPGMNWCWIIEVTRNTELLYLAGTHLLIISIWHNSLVVNTVLVNFDLLCLIGYVHTVTESLCFISKTILSAIRRFVVWLLC